MLLLNLLFFVLSCIVLFGSGMLLVKTLENIAKFLRITEFAAAFIIMAIATSLPELFVGISSAISATPALSLGNIVGANILNLTLIMGLIVLAARGIKIKSKEVKRDSFFMFFFIILLLILFFVDNSLSRADGIILVVLFFVYCYELLKRRKKEFKEHLHGHVKRINIVLNSILLVLLIAVMLFSSRFVIHYAKLLSIDLNLPPLMIGMFLISIGTVLPELTFGISAALQNKGEMVLGDQIGTIVVNSTLVIGITAIIHTITTDVLLFMISSAFLLFSAFLFLTFFQGRKISIIEGITLIFLYLLFVFIEFYVKMIR